MQKHKFKNKIIHVACDLRAESQATLTDTAELSQKEFARFIHSSGKSAEFKNAINEQTITSSWPHPQISTDHLTINLSISR